MLLFFYIFASTILLGSVLVITSRNPVHAVLWLIFTFSNGAGLMVLMGAEFIAMMLIIIYVGAVAVLFLFVVMMLHIEYKNIQAMAMKNKLFIAMISLLLFVDLVLIILVSNKLPRPAPEAYFVLSDIQHIGRVLYTDFILPFQTAGIILFVAMVASIALTLRKRSGVRRQDVSEQLSRNKENCIRIASNDGKKGLKNLSYDG